MAIINVKKDGSGQATTIQQGMMLAQSGDTIQVEAGLFEENVDFYKSGITLQGAGKNSTEIRGIQEVSVSKTATWVVGSTTLSIPGGTSGLMVGRFLSSASGLAASTRIISVSPTSITISAATTAAKTNQNVIMPAVPSAIVVRGANHTIKDLKITAVQALESRCLADNAAIFFRNTGNGEVPASNYVLEDCIIEARGESAIMTDAAATIGNGSIRRNTIQGQTFVGASAAQVPAFGTMAKTGTVLSARTIEFSDLSGITAPHAGNSQGSEITPGLRVASISGNIVTVTANIPDAVGTSRSFSFGNVQFNFPNVPRQMIVIQGANTATQFVDNMVSGSTGSGICFNTVATIDAIGSTITGNVINTSSDFGFAIRARGLNSVVQNNANIGTSTGYYVLPNYSTNVSISAGTMVFNSSKYWLCTQAHTSSATNAPTAAGGASFWSEITLEQVNASGIYGLGLMVIGSNTNVVEFMVSVSQSAAGQPLSVTMSKDMVKALSQVSSSAEFSNESNWRLVSFIFKKSSSAQRLVSAFRDFDAEKSVKLKSGMASGDDFELHKVIISKADRTLLVIKRSDIENAEDFDFSLQ
jgi:hypothetical protein